MEKIINTFVKVKVCKCGTIFPKEHGICPQCRIKDTWTNKIKFALLNEN